MPLTLEQSPNDTSTALIIGLDIDQVPVRLILAAANGDPTPHPLEHRGFKTLRQFSAYWTSHWGGVADIHVAAPRSSKDPLAVIPWLECQGVSVERYPWLAYGEHLNGDFSIWGLPNGYQRAYVLALYSAYRSHAAQVVRGMWARLLDMHELFDEIRIDLHRLNAAIDAQPADDIDDCPF